MIELKSSSSVAQYVDPTLSSQKCWRNISLSEWSFFRGHWTLEPCDVVLFITPVAEYPGHWYWPNLFLPLPCALDCEIWSSCLTTWSILCSWHGCFTYCWPVSLYLVAMVGGFFPWISNELGWLGAWIEGLSCKSVQFWEWFSCLATHHIIPVLRRQRVG